MIQFIRPSAGSFIHQPIMTPEFYPGILLQGFNSDVRKVGFRPLQIGPSDKYGNKPCYHLNLKGDVALLDPSQFSTNFVQNGFLDQSCTIPNLVKMFKPKGKTWQFSHLIRKGNDFVSTPKISYSKYQYSYYVFHTIRTTTSIKLTWLSENRFRSECWYETYNINQASYSSYVYVYYYEYDENRTQTRNRFYTVSWRTTTRPKIPEWIQPTARWVSYVSTRYAVTSPSPDVIPDRADFLQRLAYFRRDVVAKESSFFGQCTVRSAQALRVVKTNVFTYLFEAAWVTGISSSVRKMVKEILSSSSTKAASSIFLAYQYGVKLTILDTIELLKKPRSSVGFDLESYTTSRSQMSDQTVSYILGQPIMVSHQYFQKLYCQRHESAIIDAWARLMSVGAYPFLETAWDAVPFSFVIDWFTRFDDLLTAVDSNTILHSYAIQSCISTRRSSAMLSLSVLFPELQGIALGEITIIDYHRSVDRTPPPIWLDLTPQSFNHWVEGAALIVQRM